MSSLPRGTRRALPWLWLVAGLLATPACGDADDAAHEQPLKIAESGPPLLHLADLAAQAQGESGAAPTREPRVWRFDQPSPEWIPVPANEQRGSAPVSREQRADALHLVLGGAGMVQGGVVCDVEDSPITDWDEIVVRARSNERLSGVAIAYDVTPERPPRFPFMMGAEGSVPVFNDGSAQDYALPLEPREGHPTLTNIGLFFGAPQPAGIDIISVTLVPRGADFAESRGSRSVTRAGDTRQALYAHLPARLSWRVRVPEGGRLDTGLGCLPGESVHYTVTADGAKLLDETVTDAAAWKQVSAGLSSMAGREVQLTLAADGPAGGVALWGAPVVDGRAARGPNVIFYVIDGGGADLMSLYGYERPTTPFLEHLAREGTVFERAYSNATWTQASTASFMTSLHHSVLGGLRRGLHSTPVPLRAPTMAEQMRAGGWQTAVFTTNPNSARVIGLQRGVDVMSDSDGDNEGAESARMLHDLFWRWRGDYPGGPWWVHFQTTDVHAPNHAAPPYAGLFVSDEEREQLDAWDERLFEEAGELFGTTSIMGFFDAALARTGVPRQPFFSLQRGLYDETMVQQDTALKDFVAKLKASGEWENTLLVVGSDHGHPAGTFPRFGRGWFDPQPEPWQGALFDPYATRVPLLFVWAGHVPAGQRVTTPVSMIDVLPTMLELAGLPAPEIAQGRSLVGLMRGETTSHPPVILDEFRVDEATGQLVGNLDVVDGRWGASLEIGPVPAGSDPARGRHSVPAGGRWGAVHPWFAEAPRLLLYDLQEDPWVLKAVNDAHPELVKKYEQLLRRDWEAQQALATQFLEAGDAALDPEQLEQLQQLGYIR
jgi:arylsulfatase A-like enzyme